jgi:microcystin-dependent protein
MSDPFLAEIRMFAGNFAPTNWATCNGQIIPLQQNTALFSLIGTSYGGNGQSNFALPNMAGSAPLAAGNGAGLSQYVIGDQSGSSGVTLLQTEMPAHNHSLMAVGQDPNSATAQGNELARSSNVTAYLPPGSGSPIPMSPQAISSTGGSQSHNNLQPYLALTFIIALRGVFPQRS